jgi:hypothetical protein
MTLFVTKPSFDPEEGQSALENKHFLNLQEKLAQLQGGQNWPVATARGPKMGFALLGARGGGP